VNVLLRQAYGFQSCLLASIRQVHLNDVSVPHTSGIDLTRLNRNAAPLRRSSPANDTKDPVPRVYPFRDLRYETIEDLSECRDEI
jgi:hypothetical protein